MSAIYDFSRGVLLFQRAPKPADWNPQEIANFYKVEHILVQNGLDIEVDRGLSDEGDPWFVFCHQNGEVFLHFARVEGGYMVAGPHLPQPIWKKDFAGLLRSLQDRVPLVLPGSKGGSGATILMHPAVLLVATVATFFYQSSNTKAVAEEHHELGHNANRDNEDRSSSARLTELQAMTLMAAIVLMASLQELGTPEEVRTLFSGTGIALSADGEAYQSDLPDGSELFAVADSKDSQSVQIEADRVEIASSNLASFGGTLSLLVGNPHVGRDMKAEMNLDLPSKPLEDVPDEDALVTSAAVVKASSEPENGKTETPAPDGEKSTASVSSASTPEKLAPVPPAEESTGEKKVEESPKPSDAPIEEDSTGGQVVEPPPPAEEETYYVTYFRGMPVLHAEDPNEIPQDTATVAESEAPFTVGGLEAIALVGTSMDQAAIL